MKKLVFLGALASLVVVSVATAVPAPKVWVCKYTGKPGVDEVLKGGKNPISVNSNSIPNYQGVGSYFADGQDRSYVVALDTGQETVDCPVPENPPKEDEPETPVTETPVTTTPVVEGTTFVGGGK
jgi:hypothetical protein